MAWTTVGNIRGPVGALGPQGPEGPQGPAGPVGPAGLAWRGAWAADQAYSVDDAVVWGGSSYFCTIDRLAGDAPPTGTSVDPGTDDTALNTGWALLASQGSPGSQGPQGIQGPDGPAGPAGPTGAAGPAGDVGPAGPAGPTGATGPIGPQGEPGTTGPAGPAGPTGPRGSKWFTGNGAPGTITGAVTDDQYLDLDTGDVYTLVV